MEAADVTIDDVVFGNRAFAGLDLAMRKDTPRSAWLYSIHFYLINDANAANSLQGHLYTATWTVQQALDNLNKNLERIGKLRGYRLLVLDATTGQFHPPVFPDESWITCLSPVNMATSSQENNEN